MVFDEMETDVCQLSVVHKRVGKWLGEKGSEQNFMIKLSTVYTCTIGKRF